MTSMARGVLDYAGGSGSTASAYAPLTAPPNVSGMTWMNQQAGATKTSNSDGSYSISSPSAGPAQSITHVGTSLHAVPYTIELGCVFSMNLTNHPVIAAGLGITDGTKLVTFWLVGDLTAVTQVGVSQYTNTGTLSLTPRQVSVGSYFSFAQPTFFRIVDDGVNRTFSISNSGRLFLPIYTDTSNNFVTPTRYGPAFQGYSAGPSDLVLIDVFHQKVT